MHAATLISMATPLRAARDASRAPLHGASGSIKVATPLMGAPAASRAMGLRLGARRGMMVGARAAVMESAGRADIKLAGDYLESKELSLPFSDITLRAELDGATVRAHRGVLAMHSRVFAAALAQDSSKEECVLLRKTGADLRLLLCWMYRGEQFAKVRALRGLSSGCAVRIIACSPHLKACVCAGQHRCGVRAGGGAGDAAAAAQRGRVAVHGRSQGRPDERAVAEDAGAERHVDREPVPAAAAHVWPASAAV
jgi:hypothetical protein